MLSFVFPHILIFLSDVFLIQYVLDAMVLYSWTHHIIPNQEHTQQKYKWIWVNTKYEITFFFFKQNNQNCGSSLKEVWIEDYQNNYAYKSHIPTTFVFELKTLFHASIISNSEPHFRRIIILSCSAYRLTMFNSSAIPNLQ